MKSFSDTDVKQNDRLTEVENKTKANSFAIKILSFTVAAALSFGVCVLVTA